MTLRSVRGGVLGVLAVASVSAAQDTTATKAAILAADRALAGAASGVTAFLDKVEPSGVLLFPQNAVARLAAARGPFRARYGAAGTSFAWTPLAAIASADGGFGCTTGSTEMRTRTDTGPAPRHGRYITCWRRGADGAWRIAVHARNGETVGSAAVTLDASRAPHSAADRGGDAGTALLDADVAFSRFALDSGPGPAFAKWVASDGMLLGPRPEPPVGPAGARAAFETFSAAQRLMWLPVRSIGAAQGGLGFTVGLSVTAPVAGGAPGAHGKYITVWRREPDGRWVFVYDLGSPRPAVPGDELYADRIRRQAAADSARTSKK